MAWFYNLLIEAGCMPEHASAAVCVIGVLSIYILFKTLISLFER